MFEYFRNRVLISQVAAELKAQSKDQDLVRDICFSATGMQIILELCNSRFPKKGKLRYFIVTTFLLAETLSVIDIPLSVKAACLQYLTPRRQKISAYLENSNESPLITYEDLKALDSIADIGIQLYLSQRG